MPTMLRGTFPLLLALTIAACSESHSTPPPSTQDPAESLATAEPSPASPPIAETEGASLDDDRTEPPPPEVSPVEAEESTAEVEAKPPEDPEDAKRYIVVRAPSGTDRCEVTLTSMLHGTAPPQKATGSEHRFEVDPELPYSIHARDGQRRAHVEPVLGGDRIELTLREVAHFEGRVVSREGRGIDAVVRLTGRPAWFTDAPTTTSDPETGAFRFEALSPGAHLVIVEPRNPEFAGKSVGHLALESGRTTSLDVVLDSVPMVTWSGVIQANDGRSLRPLAGATIEVRGTPVQTRSDADGRFTIRSPRDGQVTVSCPGYLWTNRTGPFSPDTEVRLSIPAAKRIRGRVHDAAGNPIPGALVRVFAPSQPRALRSRDAETDDEGRFEAPYSVGSNAVEPLLLVSAPGFTPAELRIEDPEEPIEVVLENQAWLLATDETCVDLPPTTSALVRTITPQSLAVRQTRPYWRRHAVPGYLGRMVFSGLVPGKYDAPGVHLEPGGNRLAWTSDHRIREGRVTFEGKPVARAVIRETKGQSPGRVVGQTDADGRFRICVPGAVTIQPSVDSAAAKLALPKVVREFEPNGETRIELVRFAELEGKVSAPDPASVIRVTIETESSFETLSTRPGAPLRLRVPAQGKFTIKAAAGFRSKTLEFDGAESVPRPLHIEI